MDGVDLLRKFDPSGVAGLRDAPEGELVQLVEKLGGFPRALESVAGMLLEDPLLRLADVRQNTGLLEGEISSAVVQQALKHLNAEAMRLLGALAIFARPVGYDGLAYLLSPYAGDSTLRPLLARLIRAGFVKVNGTRQELSLHPIDQGYCYEQIPDGEPGGRMAPTPFTRAALHRRAAEYFRERRLPKSRWQRLSDIEPQVDEFKHWVLAGDGDQAAQVLLEIDRDYLWEWGYRDLLRRLYATLGEWVREPHLALKVARRKAWLDFIQAPQRSAEEFARLLEEARQLGFVQEEADALDDLAQTYRRGNLDLVKGIEYHRQALSLYRRIGVRRGEADALGGLGAIYVQVDPEEAIDHLLAAIAIQRELGHRGSESFLLSMLGAAYYYLGATDQAKTTLEQASQIAVETRSPEAFVRALGTLSILYVAASDLPRVRECVEKAVEHCRELIGVPFSATVAFYCFYTALYLALYRHFEDSVDLLERTIQQAAGAPGQMIDFLNICQSLVLMLKGDYSRARRVLPGDPETLVKRSLNNFWCGILLVKTGETEQARSLFQYILDTQMEPYSRLSVIQHRQTGIQPTLATALAGLALLDKDPAMAAHAAKITREGLGIRNWSRDLYPALVDLLMQEPNGDILAPLQKYRTGPPA